MKKSYFLYRWFYIGDDYICWFFISIIIMIDIQSHFFISIENIINVKKIKSHIYKYFPYYIFT